MNDQKDEGAIFYQEDTESPLAKIMLKAESQGYLLASDLLAAIPEAEDNLADLEETFIQVINQGIRIYKSIDEAEEGNHPKIAQSVEDGPAIIVDSFDLSSIAASDTLSLYLKEMSQVPLLTAEEEIALVKTMDRGRKAEQALRKLQQSTEESDILRVKVKAGYLARDHLIRANTRLVVSIAKKYRGQSVPLADLIQEGNLGLMKAIEKFDYRRGYRLSTYATWWIRQAISRAVADQSRTIRIPVHINDHLRKLFQVSRNLEQTRGYKPRPEELAGEMNMSVSKVRWMLQVSRYPVSLEEPLSNEEDDQIGSFIEDKEVPAPPDIATYGLLQDKLQKVFTTLDPREARILSLRFGLQNGRSHTLEEIGQMFGLTRERIRQIEGIALRKLRHPRRARQLRDFLG